MNWRPALLAVLLTVAKAACTTIEEARPADPDAPTEVADTPVSPPEVEVAPADEGGPEEAQAPELAGDPPPEEAAVEAEAPPEVAEASDVAEPKPDGPCVPDCTGKVCGLNNCGTDVCGYCPYGYSCNPYGTACVIDCPPNCAGKSCGDDGCGGYCGPPALLGKCEEGYQCTKEGTCVPEVVCTPDCEGRVCGNGGCEDQENACGTCAEQEYCTDEGKCIPGPCAGVDPKLGACKDGMKWLRCVKDGSGNPMLLTVDCSQFTDMICGWDQWEGRFGCIPKPPCVPSCDLPDGSGVKECGDDGCGHETCGQCPVGWGCPAFKCRPVDGATCGWITSRGYCWDDEVLYWCSSENPTQGQISSKDCKKDGKTCEYHQPTDMYDCM